RPPPARGSCVARGRMETRNSASDSFGGEYYRLFTIPSRAAHPVARVEKRDEEHETDQQHRAGGLQMLEDFGTYRPPPNRLKNSQGNVPSVQNGERQNIQQRQVNIEHHAEPEDTSPAVLAFEEGFVNPHDHHWTPELLQADFRFTRRHGLERGNNLARADSNLLRRQW